MGAIIAAVKAGAGQILGNLTLNISDLYTGGGRYKDRRDAFTFSNTASLANGTSGAQSAINAWEASGGFDEPEGQLYALWQLATGGYGWRPSASKIIVWFGDAPGHNPICKGYVTANNPPYNVTLDVVKNNLTAAGIKVLALSVGANRLDLPFGASISSDNPCGETYPQPQQATVLTTATGGQLYSGVQVGTIVQVIIDSIQNATCPGYSEFAGAASFAAARVAAAEPLPIGTIPATN
ncbi:hyalin [Chlorella sorokiniana]|uniref:Hyalin n=1 Tax=Chlorella sorokiniana TaxID=3076 RepID=A0A2P6TN39_CHLSO|nr:hyalin [Chlorella sorokiniana]|eukprot:PRW45746.1 hyalin [Chlorella sorokiniana]